MLVEFDDIIEKVLEHEGGLVDDPKDAGGLTNLGISQRAYPDEDIRGLTVERAKELYNQGYRKSEILRMIIKEFKLERDINSRSWPKWLSEIG